ncbi:MAG: hypothetical protein J6Y56_03845 [Fibrobacterales bacterium]|nr:hypothetical protein [Fibrobacterales bacterium]
MKTTSKRSLLLFCAVGFASLLSAQNPAYTGLVVDARSGDPIDGATVSAARAGTFAVTGADGAFGLASEGGTTALSGAAFRAEAGIRFSGANRELRISLPGAADVELTLFDVRGQALDLHRASYGAGDYSFSLDAMLERPLSTGLYVLRAKVGGEVRTFSLAGTGDVAAVKTGALRAAKSSRAVAAETVTISKDGYVEVSLPVYERTADIGLVRLMPESAEPMVAPAPSTCDGAPAFATGVDWSTRGYEAVWNNALYTCAYVPYFCNVGTGHTPVTYAWTKLGECGSSGNSSVAVSSSSKKVSSSSSSQKASSSSSQKVSSSSSSKKASSSSSSQKASSSSSAKVSSSSAASGNVVCKAWASSLYLVNGNWSDGPVVAVSGTTGNAYQCKAGQGSFCYYYKPDHSVYGGNGSWPVYESVGVCGQGASSSSSSQKVSSSSSSKKVSSSSSSQKVSSSSSSSSKKVSSSSSSQKVSSSSSSKKTSSSSSANASWRSVSLKSTISTAQPMTGLVLWSDNSKASTYANSISMEYAYCWPSKVVKGQKSDGSIDYDWSWFESLLNSVSSRGHQAIVRFTYEYPNNAVIDSRNPGTTAVPAYLKARSDYHETYSSNPGGDGPTWYADWSNDSLKSFTRRFYADFAKRYDNDPRLALLEVGFGHWGEYHIYGTTLKLGTNFPDKEYQKSFLRHVDTLFKSLPWAVSIDAADDEYTPIVGSSTLMGLDFGLFDDSFMHSEHEKSQGEGYNEGNWIALNYANRWKNAPMGGEVSYYSSSDQKNFLKPSGMYGVTWEQMASKYHVSFMIANDAPTGSYGTKERFLEAALASGYKFRVTAFERTDDQARVTIKNEGVAPLYRDAYVAVNGTRGGRSLKGLLPGESATVTIPATGSLKLTIESDFTVSGRPIGYLADL